MEEDGSRTDEWPAQEPARTVVKKRFKYAGIVRAKPGSGSPALSSRDPPLERALKSGWQPRFLPKLPHANLSAAISISIDPMCIDRRTASAEGQGGGMTLPCVATCVNLKDAGLETGTEHRWEMVSGCRVISVLQGPGERDFCSLNSVYAASLD